MSITLPLGAGRLDWDGWLYGLGAAFIGGGSSAVVAGGVTAFVIPDATTAQKLTVMGATFVCSGAFNMAAYLSKQPLPSKVTTTTSEAKQVTPESTTTVKQTTEVKEA